MAEIRLSIITASYRRTPWLGEMLDSVLKSGYHFRNTELIFCDDGAPAGDSDLPTAQEYARRYPDIIRIISNPERRGIAGSFSHLVDEARGEYILPFDNDDVFCLFDIDRDMDYLDHHPECAATYGKKLLFGDTNDSGIRIHGGDESVFAMTLDPRTVHNAMVIRAADLRKVGNYQPTELGINTAGADLFLWLRLTCIKELRFTNELRAFYRVHQKQKTAGALETYNMEYQFIRQYVKQRYSALTEAFKHGRTILIKPDERRPAAIILGALYAECGGVEQRIALTRAANKLFPLDYGAREYRIKELMNQRNFAAVLTECHLMSIMHAGHDFIEIVALNYAISAATAAGVDVSEYESLRHQLLERFFTLTDGQSNLLKRLTGAGA